jgi:hypothetical protein
MRFLRHAAGYTRRYEISDLTIRSELQIFNIKDKFTDKIKDCMTTFSGWTHTEQPAKQLNINPPDIETSDAQREDGKMTSEDSYMIGTDL